MAVLVVAGLSVLAGGWLLVMHATTDPLADVRAYYEAGARLNRGEPLYDGSAGAPGGLYLYPPLIAVLFRPLALLPFAVAAGVWEVVVVAATWLTLRRIGVGSRTRLAVALLAVPLAWALAIGQAEPIVTLFLAMGSPVTVALAGYLKIFPWLAAAYWIGRRDAHAFLSFVAWVLALGLVQLAVEPAGTVAYLRLEWFGPAFGVRNLSPYAIHPLLWAVAVAVLLALAITRARTRAGWPLAVAVAVLASPRLLLYQLMTLLAALGGPRDGPAPPASPAPGPSGGSRAERAG
jgi:hypothetical protein